mmetsp:Transcript_5881/g.23202  ORF Transcript_5881/g.23202 Transcript_5881/m.23202 type:complete len:269 (-) Transcript_5881:139-945(-)
MASGWPSRPRRPWAMATSCRARRRPRSSRCSWCCWAMRCCPWSRRRSRRCGSRARNAASSARSCTTCTGRWARCATRSPRCARPPQGAEASRLIGPRPAGRRPPPRGRAQAAAGACSASRPSKIRPSTSSCATSSAGATFQPAPPVISTRGSRPSRWLSCRNTRSTAPVIAKVPPVVRASEVLVGKSRTSPVGTRRPAVPPSSARSMMPWPGRIRPPRNCPSLDSASTVTAVPIITTSTGPSKPRLRACAWAPITATQRSAPRRVGWS